MSRLLYVRLREERGFEYGVPAEYSTYEEVFDLDNFSDAQTVSYAIKFISEADSKVIIDAVPKANFGKLLHLFNYMKTNKTLSLEILGEHKMLGFLRV